MNLYKWQRKILLLCWFAYAGAYLCRSNISIALPGMIQAEGWSRTSAGLVGTMFFWAYAVGQLINGAIGDKVKTRPFIFTGLCISSLINLIIGFSSNLTVIMVLWCVNGFFLSTLWGPIVKTVSLWFGEEKRTKVAMILSFSMIAGYFLAWGLIGQLIVTMSWKWAFRIPAAIVFIYSLIWLVNMRNSPEEVGLSLPAECKMNQEEGGPQESQELQESQNPQNLQNPEKSRNPQNPQNPEKSQNPQNPQNPQNSQNPQEESVSFKKIVIGTRLWLVAVICIVQGVVKDGIALWAPTFLTDTQHLSPSVVPMVSLAIPLMSFFGIFSVGWLNKVFGSNEKKSLITLFAATIASSVLLYFFFEVNLYITVVLLGITIALMYGANTILLALIPLKYVRYGKVSTVAGFLDFCSYAGAAAAGILTGFIIDSMGWEYVLIAWAALALLGMVFTLRINKKIIMKNNKENGVYGV